MLHNFGNETAMGINENGVVKLLKEVNEEYGTSHPLSAGRKVSAVKNALENYSISNIKSIVALA